MKFTELEYKGRNKPCSVGEVADETDTCVNCCGEEADNPCEGFVETGVDEGEGDWGLVTKPRDGCRCMVEF